MSVKLLSRYVDEFCHCYSNRGAHSLVTVRQMALGKVGQLLTYPGFVDRDAT